MENGVQRQWQANFDLIVIRSYDLVAVFEPEKYSVQVFPNPEPGGEVFGTKYNIVAGTQVNILAKPFFNYNFISWTNFDDGSIKSLDADHEFEVFKSYVLIANFEKKTHKITVYPEPPEYGIVYTDNGNMFQYYLDGDTATVTAEPNQYRRFVKWIDADTDSLISELPQFTFPVTKSRNLLGIFERETYCITLIPYPDIGGHVSGDAGCNHPFGELITICAEANLDWEFVVWMENGLPVYEYPCDTFNITAHRTLVALFQRKSFTITLEPVPSYAGEVWETPQHNVTYGTQDTVHARALDNYIFTHWSEDEHPEFISFDEDYAFPVTCSRHLKAHFELQTFTILTEAEPPWGGITWGDGENIPYGTDTTVCASPNEHFTFMYWTKNDDPTPVFESFCKKFTVVESCTYIAHFKADTYPITLTAEPPEGGEVFGDGIFGYGTEITVTAIPEECYNFLNWTENGDVVSNNPNYTFIVEEPRELVANFVQKEFDIFTMEEPSGGGTLTGGGEKIPCGTIITLTADPNIGYIFDYWTLNGAIISLEPVFDFEVMEACTLVAKFTFAEYRITLYALPFGGGSATESGFYPHNYPLTIHAAANPEFDFLFWTENEDTIYYNPEPSFLVTSSRILTAHFDTANITITTRPEPLPAGETSPDTITVKYGTSVTVTATPENHFLFMNWTINDEFETQENPYTFPATRSCQMVANFTLETHNVIVMADPDDSGWALHSLFNVPYGTPDTLHAIPFPCYEFVNWTIEGEPVSTAPDYPFTVTQSCTIVAHFTPKMVTVTLDDEPSGSGMVSQTPQHVHCEDYITIHAEPLSNYNFLYWTLYNDTVIFSRNPDPPAFPVYEDMNLVAHFELKTFDIIPIASPPWGGIVWDTLYNVPWGTTAYMGALAKEFFEFDKWTEADGTTIVNMLPDFSFQVTESRTLIAHFTTVSFPITLSADPPVPIGGTVEGDGQYDYNSEITITAIPDTCYYFVCWTEGEDTVSITPSYTFTVDGAHHFVAHFELKMLAISASPSPGTGGQTIIIGETEDIPCGEERTVKAIPNKGYVFMEWTINGDFVSNQNPYTFEVKDSCHLVGHFEYREYYIYLDAAPPNGWGNVWTEGYYPHGDTITVHAKAFECFKFMKWTEDDETVYNLADYTFIVERERHLVAHFDTAAFEITTQAKYSSYGYTTPVDTTGISCGAMVAVEAIAYQHYRFINWTEDEDPTFYSTGAYYEFPVTRDRNLIANFEPENYNIIIDRDPPEGGQVYGGGYNLPYGTDTSILAVPFLNYDFIGWFENDVQIYTSPYQDITAQRDMDIVAKFTGKKYNIRVFAELPGYGKVWGGGDDLPYNELTTVHAKAFSGYVFKYWKEGDVKVNYDTAWRFPVTCSRDLTAVFGLKTCTITLMAKPNDGGNVLGSGDYEFGEEITIHAEEIYPYWFVDWTDEDGKIISGSKDYTFNVLKSATITANFDGIKSKVTLIAVPEEGGQLEGAGDIVQGTEHTIVAQTNTCYDFVNWMENGEVKSLTPEYTFTIDENDRTFVANFTLKYIDISVSADPIDGGAAEIIGNATDIPCGELLTVKATPFLNHVFIKWTINGEEVSKDHEFTFNTTETCELVAHFTQTPYTITLIPNPPDMGAVTGGGVFPYGKEHTVSANPYPGFMFVNWTENDSELPANADYTFTINRDRTLVANFDTTYFTVNVLSNDTLYGTACCSGKYSENEIARVYAQEKEGYRFSGWTVKDSLVSQLHYFEFIVTENTTIVANFYGLDFDTYAATLWDNTFMLDLKKLEDENYNITGCKWYKNSKEELHTYTIDQFSYSAGPNITDKLELEPTYYFFRLTTKNGSLLYSTKKILTHYQYFPPPTKNSLLVYPNPASSGCVFTVENAIPQTLMQVYNQYGVCVKTITTKDSVVTLSLNLPTGLYLIRNENKEAKVVIK
jgi:hypothetical protein